MDIFGHFYFEILPDGTLTGKYANKVRPILEPETAKPSAKEEKPLLGKYHTNWEEAGVKHESELSIIAGKSEGHYELIWKQNDTIIYSGNGFIYDDMLIGHYWKA